MMHIIIMKKIKIMNNEELSKCKTGTIVAFKTVEDNWYTGKIQTIEPPNTKYNTENFYKFNISVILPITPQWIEDGDDTVFFHTQIVDLKILENSKIDKGKTKENDDKNLNKIFADNKDHFNWEYFKEYVDTYDINKHSTGDQCTIEDMLYGLGVALYGKKYKYANGYRLFKSHLNNWLENNKNL